MSDQLRGGTTIGGYLALHQGNFNSTLKDFTSLSLTGDVSGSGGFDIDGLLTLDINVSDNSHAHTISNISGLQAALDAKAPQSTTYTKTETNSQISTGITTHTNDSSAHHTRYADSEAVAALSSADIYIPRISSPTADNVPKINAAGKLVDSGIRIDDIATGKGYAYVRRTSVVIGASPSNTISFSIANFEKITDSIIVYENLVYYMEEGVDYTITNNTTLTFNSNKPAGTRFDIIAFMNVPEAGETYSGMYVTDGSIINAKLASDVKVGSLSTLDAGITGTSRDSVVAAINSVYNSSLSINSTVPAGQNKDLISVNMAGSDYFRLRVGGASDAGYVEFATADNSSEPIYFRQYSGAFTTLARTATILDGSGNTSFPVKVTAPSFVGALSGNASSATKLFTARNIGVSGAVTGSVSFDGTSAVTIATTIAKPGTLSASSSNSTATAHTHAITTTESGAASTIMQTDAEGNVTAANTFKFGTIASMQYDSTSKTIDFVFS